MRSRRRVCALALVLLASCGEGAGDAPVDAAWLGVRCAAPHALGTLRPGDEVSASFPLAGVLPSIDAPYGAPRAVALSLAIEGDAQVAALVIDAACSDPGAEVFVAVDVECPPSSDALGEHSGDEPARVRFVRAISTVEPRFALITVHGLTQPDARLDVRVGVRRASSPRLERAELLIDPERVELRVIGADDEGDVRVARVLGLDAVDAPVRLGDHGGAGLELPVAAAAGALDERAEQALVSVRGAASSAWVWLEDEARLSSGRLRVPVRYVDRVGRGARCDGVSTACARELACLGGVCDLDPARAAACDDAPRVELEAPVDRATRRDVSAPFSRSLLDPSCADEPASEARLSVRVPEGRHDLSIVSRALLRVSARSECADPGSELGCEVWGLELLDVASGPLALVLEPLGEAPSTGAEVTLTLRPLLASGARCDPAGVESRCLSGTCDALTARCP